MDNITNTSGLKMIPRMEAVTSGGVARWRPGVRHKVVTPAPGSAHSTPAPSRGRCETPALLPREI